MQHVMGRILALMMGVGFLLMPLGQGLAEPRAIPGQQPLLALPPQASPKTPSRVTALGRLPMTFIANQGQADAQVKFYLQTGGQTLWLTHEGITFDLLRTKGRTAQAEHYSPQDPPDPKRRPGEPSVEHERLVFTQDFLGANQPLKIEARAPRPGRYHYFLGNDPTKWRTGVQGYAEVIYREVWEGIDLKVSGNGQALEQEFIVRPEADVGRIRVAYRGIEGLRVAADGALLISTAFGELRESAPWIYQVINGERKAVVGQFKLLSETSYTFEVGSYERRFALVIDPTLVYSTYLGGNSDDGGSGIAVDRFGNAYVAGGTFSRDFPTTPGAFQTVPLNIDAFVTKLNPDGSALVYSTVLGGFLNEGAAGIAVDRDGNAYVTGSTVSFDFPVRNAFQPNLASGTDAFVTKLEPSGAAIIYSTYLGGRSAVGNESWGPEDAGTGIAIDAAGSAYVTGYTFSYDFPTTPGAQQPARNANTDAFITKLTPDGSALAYSTFVGGAAGDFGRGIVVDADGHAYVTGRTAHDFPTTAGAFQTTPPSRGGGADAFVAKLTPDGSALAYSTYLGGGEALAIALDSSGHAYVTGYTNAGFDRTFPTTPGAFQTTYGGDIGCSGAARPAFDAFVTKLNPTGSALVYSTLLGGHHEEVGRGIAVDANGNAYVVGNTGSSNFPTASAVQPTYGAGGPLP